jgi:predicted aminopeptidase
MAERSRRLKLLKRVAGGVFLLCVAVYFSGCQTAHYYRQAIAGEYEILAHRQSITNLIANPQTDSKLREKFELVLELRKFAQTDLNLPIDKYYLSYVDLHRRFAVWNVHAAPEFSLKPKSWWYPFVGSLKYRGYFSEPDARQYGAQLAKKGNDVYVEGVEAYSTLGWFSDPLLNTFIHNSNTDLAEIIFHELAHQRLFFGGDTDFNEAFATAVSEEGVRRWLRARHDQAGLQHYLTELERNRQFVALVMDTRQELKKLYGEEDDKTAPRPPLSSEMAAQERENKARITAQLRERYEALKKSWGGYAGYDGWFKRSLNNAQLNTISVYYDLVPGFQVLLERSGGDLEVFFNKVREMKKLGKDGRHEHLHMLAGQHQPGDESAAFHPSLDGR